MGAPVVIEIQLTPQQHDALTYLARFGLYGSCADEVAEYLVMRGLQDLWRDKVLPLSLPKDDL